MKLPGWLHVILTQNFTPLFVARNNPVIYPYIIAAIAFTFLGTVSILFYEKKGFWLDIGDWLINGIMSGLFFIFCAIGIEAIWLGYSTPVTRLIFLPANDVVALIAVAIHATLTILGVTLMWVLWEVITIFNPFLSRKWLDGATFLVFSVLMIAGWETGHWPGGYLIPAEISDVAIMAFLTNVLWFPTTTTDTRGGLEHLLYYLILSAGFWWIVLSHNISGVWWTFILNSFLLFFAIIWLDHLLVGLYKMARYKKVRKIKQADAEFGWRGYGVLILVIALGVAGAQGYFMPFMRNTGITGAVWIGVCACAAICLLIKSLFSMINHDIDIMTHSSPGGQGLPSQAQPARSATSAPPSPRSSSATLKRSTQRSGLTSDGAKETPSGAASGREIARRAGKIVAEPAGAIVGGTIPQLFQFARSWSFFYWGFFLALYALTVIWGIDLTRLGSIVSVGATLFTFTLIRVIFRRQEKPLLFRFPWSRGKENFALFLLQPARNVMQTLSAFSGLFSAIGRYTPPGNIVVGIETLPIIRALNIPTIFALLHNIGWESLALIIFMGSIEMFRNVRNFRKRLAALGDAFQDIIPQAFLR